MPLSAINTNCFITAERSITIELVNAKYLIYHIAMSLIQYGLIFPCCFKLYVQLYPCFVTMYFHTQLCIAQKITIQYYYL